MPIQNEPAPDEQFQVLEKNNDSAYWRKWYLAVVVFLVAQVVIYYLITEHFK